MQVSEVPGAVGGSTLGFEVRQELVGLSLREFLTSAQREGEVRGRLSRFARQLHPHPRPGLHREAFPPTVHILGVWGKS